MSGGNRIRPFIDGVSMARLCGGAGGGGVEFVLVGGFEFGEGELGVEWGGGGGVVDTGGAVADLGFDVGGVWGEAEVAEVGAVGLFSEGVEVGLGVAFGGGGP